MEDYGERLRKARQEETEFKDEESPLATGTLRVEIPRKEMSAAGGDNTWCAESENDEPTNVEDSANVVLMKYQALCKEAYDRFQAKY